MRNPELAVKTKEDAHEEGLSPEQQAAKDLLIAKIRNGNFADSREIQNESNLPAEVISQAVIEGLTVYLARYHINDVIDGALEIRKIFNLSESDFHQVVKGAFLMKLSWLDINDAIRFKNEFALSEDEVNRAVKEMFYAKLLKHRIDDAMRIKTDFNLPEAEVKRAAEEAFLVKISEGYIETPIDLKNKFNLSEEFLASEEVRLAIEALFLNQFSVDGLGRIRIDAAIMIKNEFNLSDKIYSSEEVLQGVKKEIISNLSEKNIDEAIRITNEFNNLKETIESNEVQQIAESIFKSRLSGNDIDIAVKIKNAFNLPEEKMHESIKEKFISNLSYSYNNAVKIKDAFNLPEAEVHQAAKEMFISKLRAGYIDSALKIMDDFNLPEAEVYQMIKTEFISWLKSDNIDGAVKIKNIFNLREEDVNQAVEEEFLSKLAQGKGEDALRIRGQFNISETVITSVKAHHAAKEGLILMILKGADYAVDLVRNELRLSGEEVRAAAKNALIKEISQMNFDEDEVDDFNISIIKDKYGLSDEEVRAAAKEVFAANLTEGNINHAIDIKNWFDLPKSEMGAAVETAFKVALDKREYINVSNILYNFNLSEAIIGDLKANNRINQIYRELIRLRQFATVEKLLKTFPNKAMEASLDVSFDIFGDFLTLEMYDLVDSIFTAQNNGGLAQFGITAHGPEGLKQLKEKIRQLKAGFRRPDFQGEQLEHDWIAALFKNYVRYENSEWGEHGNENFELTVDKHRAFRMQGLIKDLPPAYAPSEVLRVDKVDRAKQFAHQYSEPFTNRFKVLRQSIVEARALVDQKKPLNLLSAELEDIKAKLLEGLQAKLAKLSAQENAKPQAVEHLQKSINQLTETDFRSVSGFEKNFNVLVQYKEFEPSLRKFVFYLAFHAYRDQRWLADAKLSGQEPDLDKLSWTLEFIDHITNQETRKKYFKDEKAKDNFLKITSARALAEEYAQVQNQDVLGQTSLQFIPTRGLLMEFSGHIADACWASKEDSLAKNHPNKSAMIMVQNPDSKDERLAGSCILIEAKSAKGDDLLIIRGLNPIENLATAISTASFYEQTTAYLKEVAKKLNRKLAIVVDDHRGGSGSNRQSVFDYLRANAMKKNVKLASEDETTFNDYNIVDNCYLVE